MSNTELITESDLKNQTEKNDKFLEAIGIDSRSYEMLLVLNEVFDSIHTPSKSYELRIN